MPDTNLPFGSEFSPAQIDLVRLLEMVQAVPGSIPALEAAIRAEYFEGRETGADNKRKLAMNCRLGLIGYGIITAEGQFSELGQELLGLKETPMALLDAFARHILVNLNGLGVIHTAQDMHAHNEQFSLPVFRTWLAERGHPFSQRREACQHDAAMARPSRNRPHKRLAD